MIDATELEKEIAIALDSFYEKRISGLNSLSLKKTLKSKNPYLYKAIGTQKASEIVEQIVLARISSSDETIFGNEFFEPIAEWVARNVHYNDPDTTVTIAAAEGVDIAIQNKDRYLAIAVKSGTKVFNKQSKSRQISEFRSLRSRLSKLRKQFDPLVGYGYGRKQQRKNTDAPFRELAGQRFWEELTGEENFYLRIIRLMSDKPKVHAPEFQEALNKAVNRLVKEMSDSFVLEDGSIDWDAWLKLNSGK